MNHPKFPYLGEQNGKTQTDTNRRRCHPGTRAEHHAKSERLGICAGQFVMPWDWWRGKRLQAEAANDDTSAACLIKGNILKSGRGISKGL